MKHILRFGFGALGLALALGLAACGGAGASTSAGGSPQPLSFKCVSAAVAHPIDTESVTIACTVTNAPSAASSFTLNYAVVDASGVSHPLPVTCKATLTHGAGVCTKTYNLPVPLANAKIVVTGSLFPDHQALGPVTPTKVPPTNLPTPPANLTPIP